MATMSMTLSSVVPFCRARVAAVWMVTPSARGSCTPQREAGNNRRCVGVLLPPLRLGGSKPWLCAGVPAQRTMAAVHPLAATHRVRHAQLDDCGACLVQLLECDCCCLQVGVTSNQEWDERDPAPPRPSSSNLCELCVGQHHMLCCPQAAEGRAALLLQTGVPRMLLLLLPYPLFVRLHLRHGPRHRLCGNGCGVVHAEAPTHALGPRPGAWAEASMPCPAATECCLHSGVLGGWDQCQGNYCGREGEESNKNCSLSFGCSYCVSGRGLCILFDCFSGSVSVMAVSHSRHAAGTPQQEQQRHCGKVLLRSGMKGDKWMHLHDTIHDTIHIHIVCCCTHPAHTHTAIPRW